jgi:hypothetical protein
MFHKTRVLKRFIRRNKTKFFIATTAIATGIALKQKNQADKRLLFIGEKDLVDEYVDYLYPEK